MKHLARLILTLLLVAGAYGQIASRMTGIKIKESSFDPQTHIVKLVFINDSVSDITAYGYELSATNKSPEEPSHDSWTQKDELGPWIDHRIERRYRPWMPLEWPDHHPIHPGESREISREMGPAVVHAEIRINMVAYADGFAEVADERAFKCLRKQRAERARAAKKIVEIGNRVLSRSNNDHPLLTLSQGLDEITDKSVGPRHMTEDICDKPLDDESEPLYFKTVIDDLQHLEDTANILHWIIETLKQQGKTDERDVLREFIAVNAEKAAVLDQGTQLRAVPR
jgi:hypothetical protein